ncbi:MAG TPA: response regulator [Methylovirgula sp.]
MTPLARPKLAGRRVLVVEDELLLRIALAADLRAAECDVVETGSADEAWDYLQAGGAVDLVFSDICMPGAMDGVELADRLKGRYPNLSVILTSGSHHLHEPDVKFLAKPYEFDHAVQFILDALTLRQGDTVYDAARHG